MFVTQTAAATGQTSAQSQAGGEATGADFQSFLQLLTAQLENQDPLNPQDGTEFVAQLASFSTVEQLIDANARLDEIAAASAGDGLDRYAPLIGREAEAPGAPAFFDGEAMRFRLPPVDGGRAVEARIVGPDGAVVATLPVSGETDAIVWDGTTADGVAPEALYTVTGVYAVGEATETRPAVAIGRIVEVTLRDGEARLRLEGGAEVDPADVTTLRETPATD